MPVVLAVFAVLLVLLLGGVSTILVLRNEDVVTSPGIQSVEVQSGQSKTEREAYNMEIMHPNSNSDMEKAQDITNSFVYIHNRIYLTLNDEKFSLSVIKSVSDLNFTIVNPHQSNIADMVQENRNTIAVPSELPFVVPSLKDISLFNCKVSDLERVNAAMKTVFQAGSDPTSQATLAFLLGCHMMLSHGLGFEETYLAVSRIPSIKEPQGCEDSCMSVRSCLRAFCRAKCHSWIRFTDPDEACEDTSSIHIDEHLHYARRARIRFYAHPSGLPRPVGTMIPPGCPAAARSPPTPSGAPHPSRAARRCPRPRALDKAPAGRIASATRRSRAASAPRAGSAGGAEARQTSSADGLGL